MEKVSGIDLCVAHVGRVWRSVGYWLDSFLICRSCKQRLTMMKHVNTYSIYWYVHIIYFDYIYITYNYDELCNTNIYIYITCIYVHDVYTNLSQLVNPRNNHTILKFKVIKILHIIHFGDPSLTQPAKRDAPGETRSLTAQMRDMRRSLEHNIEVPVAACVQRTFKLRHSGFFDIVEVSAS